MANGKKADQATGIIIDKVTLYSDGEGGFAAYKINGACVTEKITSKNFKRFIRKALRDVNLSLNDNQLKEVIADIESEAVFDGKRGTVYNRVGKTETGNILINPCYDSGDIIEVTPEGWTIRQPYTHDKKNTLKDIPIMLKTKGMKSMPFPVRGHGNLIDLEQFLRSGKDDNKFLLVSSFIIQSFFYDGPFPIIVIVAEKGSGKTFSTMILKSIIDPHEAPTLSIPRDPRDMFSTAGVSWVLAYDNFSKVQQWLSDLFCRFSTGNATIDRELFTNGEAYIFSAKRPGIVNGINDFFSQPDVLERSIIFENKRIIPAERKPEQQLLREFNEKLPGIFFDILELLSTVLRTLPDITVESPTRMADFCHIGEATCQAMGYEEGIFLEAYRDNLKQANDITLESSIVAPVIKTLVENQISFRGTATDLLEKLNNLEPELSRSKYWPKTGTVLSGTLKRLAQNFRETGISVEIGRDRGSRWIEIIKEREGAA